MAVFQITFEFFRFVCWWNVILRTDSLNAKTFARSRVVVLTYLPRHTVFFLNWF